MKCLFSYLGTYSTGSSEASQYNWLNSAKVTKKVKFSQNNFMPHLALNKCFWINLLSFLRTKLHSHELKCLESGCCYCRQLITFGPTLSEAGNVASMFYGKEVSFLNEMGLCVFKNTGSVTRLGDFLHFGQPFKAGGNNFFTQITDIIRQ